MDSELRRHGAVEKPEIHAKARGRSFERARRRLEADLRLESTRRGGRLAA
jgi:hypothetical protein